MNRTWRVPLSTRVSSSVPAPPLSTVLGESAQNLCYPLRSDTCLSASQGHSFRTMASTTN
jgi:hypothetical protein